jgi:hypothetical protein
MQHLLITAYNIIQNLNFVFNQSMQWPVYVGFLQVENFNIRNMYGWKTISQKHKKQCYTIICVFVLLETSMLKTNCKNHHDSSYPPNNNFYQKQNFLTKGFKMVDYQIWLNFTWKSCCRQPGSDLTLHHVYKLL